MQKYENPVASETTSRAHPATRVARLHPPRQERAGKEDYRLAAIYLPRVIGSGQRRLINTGRLQGGATSVEAGR